MTSKDMKNKVLEVIDGMIQENKTMERTTPRHSDAMSFMNTRFALQALRRDISKLEE